MKICTPADESAPAAGAAAGADQAACANASAAQLVAGAKLADGGPESALLIRSQIRYEAPAEGANMARELWHAFQVHRQRVLLVDGQRARQWTGAELRDTVGRAATGLVRRAGVRPNDIVMTICEHTGAEILAALGAVLAGAALYGTSPQDGYSESRVLCELAKPDVLVVSSRLHGRALALRNSVPALAAARIIWLDNPFELDENNNAPGQQDLAQLKEAARRDQVLLFDELLAGPLDEQLLDSIAAERIRPREHVLTYMLTSGSTGRPKVVQSTHEELVHGLYSMVSASRHSVGSAPNASGPRNPRPPRGPLLPVGPDKVFAGDLPLDHGAGLNTMFLALVLGAKYVVMPSYDVDTFWQTVHDFRITTSIASTTFGYKLFARLKQLIEANQAHRWDLSSLEYITFAGAKLACLELIGEVRRAYPQLRVGQAYGCTEIGFISMVHPDEFEHLDSTGYLFPGLCAKIVDRERAQQPLLGPNEAGELCVTAQSKFKAYRCHPDEDGARIFSDCHDGAFYRTGDQAHVDAQGRLYVHGRFKDTLVLMEDWKVLPSELEQLIDEHPLVGQSAVVGTPNEELPGCHKPRAYVKLIGATEAASLVAAAAAAAANASAADPEAGQRGRLAERLLAQDLEFVRADILQFVAERTARPKHLTGGLEFVAEFPRVGLLNKVDRKALARLAASATQSK